MSKIILNEYGKIKIPSYPWVPFTVDLRKVINECVQEELDHATQLKLIACDPTVSEAKRKRARAEIYKHYPFLFQSLKIKDASGFPVIRDKPRPPRRTDFSFMRWRGTEYDDLYGRFHLRVDPDNRYIYWLRPRTAFEEPFNGLLCPVGGAVLRILGQISYTYNAGGEIFQDILDSDGNVVRKLVRTFKKGDPSIPRYRSDPRYHRYK